MRADWLCVGARCWGIGPRRAHALRRLLGIAAGAFGSRVTMHQWRRYHVSLEGTAPASVELVPVTEALMHRLREHAERDQLGTAFHIWDIGIRRGLVWLDGDAPVCIQWLFTAADNPNLRRMGEWAGLYPPLPAGTGQVEGLYAFADKRRKGAATDFEFALYERARALGLSALVTHVREENEPTHRWAAKTGWTTIGTITRVVLDLPWLHSVPVCLHIGVTAARPSRAA
jgi:hypothetical protein